MDQVCHNGDTYVCTCAQGGSMTKPTTVAFHDEELSTCPKVEAARRHEPASDIVGEAVQEWLEKQGEENRWSAEATGHGRVSNPPLPSVVRLSNRLRVL